MRRSFKIAPSSLRVDVADDAPRPNALPSRLIFTDSVVLGGDKTSIQIYIIELLRLGIVEIRSFDSDSAEEFDQIFMSYEDLRARVRDRAQAALEARLGASVGNSSSSSSNSSSNSNSSNISNGDSSVRCNEEKSEVVPAPQARPSYMDSPSRRLRAPAPASAPLRPPPSCSSPFALSARDMLLRDIEDKLIGQYVVARASIVHSSMIGTGREIVVSSSASAPSGRMLQLAALPGDVRVSTGTSFPALVPRPEGESDFDVPLLGGGNVSNTKTAINSWSGDGLGESKSRTASVDSLGDADARGGPRGRSFGDLVQDLFLSSNDATTASTSTSSAATTSTQSSKSQKSEAVQTPKSEKVVRKGDKFNRTPGGGTISRNGAAVKARMAQDALEFVQNLLQSYSTADGSSDEPTTPVSLARLKERRHSRGSLSESSLTPNSPANLRSLLARSYSSGCETPENMRRASRKVLYEENELENGANLKSLPLKQLHLGDHESSSAESSPRDLSDEPTQSTLSLASFVGGSSEEGCSPLQG